MIIAKALTYYGKLKAIEVAQLINALIDSNQIKDSIMKPMYPTGDSTVL
jgi:hypothetical protein